MRVAAHLDEKLTGTQIACAVARRPAVHHHFGESALWIDGNHLADLVSGLHDAQQQLGGIPGQRPDIDKRPCRIRSCPKAGRSGGSRDATACARAEAGRCGGAGRVAGECRAGDLVLSGQNAKIGKRLVDLNCAGIRAAQIGMGAPDGGTVRRSQILH